MLGCYCKQVCTVEIGYVNDCKKSEYLKCISNLISNKRMLLSRIDKKIRKTKCPYDFNFEVIGVFFCRKIKYFFFYPVFSPLNLSLYEDKK